MNESFGSAANPVGNIPSAGPRNTSTPQPNTIVMGPLPSHGRPMEQAAPIISSPEKKKGLIIGLVIALLVLIAGGVAAAIALPRLNKKDSIAAAMTKIMSGEAPSNVAIDGDINIEIKDRLSEISNIKISLKSGIIPSSLINNSNATVTATLRNFGDVTVKVSEIYAAGGDLFFKIDGAVDAMENSGVLYILNSLNQNQYVDCNGEGNCQVEENVTANCTEDEESCQVTKTIETEETLGKDGQIQLDKNTLEFFAPMMDIIEVIDGEWLRISVDELSSISSDIEIDSSASCIADLVSGINTNSNSAAKLYEEYPFVVSAGEEKGIASKQSTVYKIGVNSTNLANYINSIQNSALSEKIYSCLNLENNVKMDESDIASIANDLPELYAEVDGENNFARLYMVSDLENGEGTITMDLNFAYPDTINVPEPLEYQDYSEVIKDISTSLLDAEDIVEESPSPETGVDN